MVFISFFLSNISFGCIKETSQGGVCFVHSKHMFNIIIDHELVLFSESTVSPFLSN